MVIYIVEGVVVDMDNLSCKIIFPNESSRQCQYYELEQVCHEIVDAYCQESSENEAAFQEFSSKYQIFPSYFDFVFGYLNCILENPFMLKDMRLVHRTGTKEYYLQKYNAFMDEYMPYKYGQAMMSYADDETLQIKQISDILFYPCFIDYNLKQIVPYEGLGHRELGREILNFLLMKNKCLCEHYFETRAAKKIDHASYLMQVIPLIRYDYNDQSKDIALVYRSDLSSQAQQQFVRKCQQNKSCFFAGDDTPYSEKLSSLIEDNNQKLK